MRVRTRPDHPNHLSRIMRFKPDLDGFLEPGFRLIEAGAGSGKTFNLELLVLRLVAERAKRVGEIVLVTYTEAAAMEMRQRVRARLKSIADGSAMERLVAAEKDGTISETGRTELASLRSIMATGKVGIEAQRMERVMAAVDELYRLRITTIHGFCQHVLSEHGPNHGFPPLASAPVAPDELIQEIAEDWYRSQSAAWPLRECVLAVRALIGDPKCDVTLLFRNIGMPKEMPEETKGNSNIARDKKREIMDAAGKVFADESLGLQKKLREFVSARRALSNVVTFDDLILKLKEALSEKSERAGALTRSVRKVFTCCLIDEFQDTDDAQWSIFSHLFLPRDEDAGSRDLLLVAVGDPKQSIYGFRGADIRTYMEARESVSDGIVHTLDNNYRTDPLVIKAFNQVFSLPLYFAEPKLRYNQALPAPGRNDVLSKHPLHIVPSTDPVQVPKEVARLLNELDKAKVSDGTVGVLVRGNQEADDLHRQLVKAGLPAALESTQSVFATQAAYVTLLLLRALLYHEDVRARRALIYARPALFGNLETRLAGDKDDVALQSIDTQLAAWIAKGHLIWTKYGFTSCWSHLTRVAPDGLETVQQSLARALFRSRLLVDLAHVGELLAARQRDRLWDPHQVVAHLEAKIAGAKADEDADAQLDESLRPESARPRVVVQTIHKSKGLEYGAVLIYFKLAGKPKDIAGTVLKTGAGDSRRLLLGSKKELEERYPKVLQDVDLQILQENARLLYVAITRAKHRLVVMARRDKQKAGIIGLHQVLDHAGIDPFSWELVSANRPPQDGEAVSWDASLISQEELSVDEYESEPAPGLSYDDQAGSLKKIKAALGSTNFTATTKHQDFPSEYLPGQEDKNVARPVPTSQDDAKEDVLLGSGAKGALFGVFIHELLDGLDFKSAAKGQLPDGRLLAAYVQERLVVSGIPAASDDANYAKMAAQIAQACQLWLSAKLPPLGDAGPAGFCLKDIDETKILSEIRFALRSDLGSESVEGIKALFLDEFTTHYLHLGKGPTPLAGVSMSKKRVEGVFTGVADLIFMHEGRFYIVDWKTNFLGNQIADYDRATVDLEMAESFYHLQYSLYAAALDAYLSQTMGAAWSYDPPSKSGSPKTASFGGVYYLFLRAFGHAGMGDIGCHHYRPTKAFIEKLRLQLANPANLSSQNEPISK